jgi:hypothetical protein
MDIKQLQELFPNWEFISNPPKITIKSKYFSMDIRKEYISNLSDIYNSIYYMTDFLQLNGFYNTTFCNCGQKHYRWVKDSSAQNMIVIILQNNFNYYLFGYNNYTKECKNSQKLIDYLKEVLDVNFMNKLQQIE